MIATINMLILLRILNGRFILISSQLTELIGGFFSFFFFSFFKFFFFFAIDKLTINSLIYIALFLKNKWNTFYLFFYLKFLFFKKLPLSHKIIFLFSGNKVVASKHTNSEYADVSDLLLWSIFANRKELAEICWLRGKDHLCKLICFLVYV